MPLEHHTHVAVNKEGVLARRDVLRGISAASLAAGTLSFSDLVSAHAGDLRKRGRACILLWMQGGPSQFETFDPKAEHEDGGETKAVATSVSDIQIADNCPRTAQVMQHLALLRWMTTKEGNHERASFLLHTGYVPTNSIKHPTLGSLVTQQLPNPDCEIPSFVRIGRVANGGAGGILGVEYDPFLLETAERPPANTSLAKGSERFHRRLDLLGRLEE